jgi:putative PIN family toxin of toxin-antitoxin system
VRIFTDTNVLASAFGTRGLCAELVEVILEQHDLFVSELVLAELGGALLRKFRLPVERQRAVDEFLRTFEVVLPPRRLPRISGLDKSDLTILATAIESRCDIFVTGDRQLLAHAPRRKAPTVLGPRDCWIMLRR